MAILDRLSLIHILSSIPQEQLLQIIFTLNPPSGVIPSNSAASGQQVFALLKWAESPSGCGLEQVQSVLDKVINQLDTISSDINSSSSQIQLQFFEFLLQLDFKEQLK